MSSAIVEFLPLSATLVSTDTGSPTRLNVKNTSDKPVSLYWIDRSGADVHYGDLQPGQTWISDTSSSHAWKLVAADGKGVKFTPSTPGLVSFGNGGAAVFTDYSEQVSHTPLGDWSTAQGYGLIDAARSLGIEDLGYSLSMNGQNNHAALNLINAPSAWAAGFTGKGVKVAVIDAGMAMHDEIGGRVVGGIDLFERDNDPSPRPGMYDDHALGVGAIIAGSHAPRGGRDTKGVAPDASLLNVRIGDGNNNIATVAEGIRWAADNGARVISVPLGSGNLESAQVEVDAIHYAFARGSVVVIAGGNSGNHGPTGPALVAQSGKAIAVGNLDALAATPFLSSNQPGATPFPWVMAASSGYLPKPDGGYGYHADGGTSFAGPYVAGLAALLFQQDPDASAGEIIARILQGARIGENEATAGLDRGLAGTAGADRLLLADGVTEVDGGAGIDTVVVDGARAGFTIAASGGGFTVGGTPLAAGSVRLTGVERLAFDDATVALDIDGNGGMVYRLYQAAFGRAPDPGGLGFWIGAKDGGVSLDAIAAQFLGSEEGIRLYGAQPSSATLVQAMYRNVLGREPDADGFAYWLDALENGGLTSARLLVDFSESAENQAAIAELIGNGFAYTPFG